MESTGGGYEQKANSTSNVNDNSNQPNTKPMPSPDPAPNPEPTPPSSNLYTVLSSKVENGYRIFTFRCKVEDEGKVIAEFQKWMFANGYLRGGGESFPDSDKRYTILEFKKYQLHRINLLIDCLYNHRRHLQRDCIVNSINNR